MDADDTKDIGEYLAKMEERKRQQREADEGGLAGRSDCRGEASCRVDKLE